MESLSKVDDSVSTPPPFFLPGVGCSTQTHSPLPGTCLLKHCLHFEYRSDPPPPTPRLTFVNYETTLYRSPALTTCHSCQTQVTTQVTYRAGTYAWLMCLVFLFCGLLCGCCLIPFFIKCFKDVYHTCPRCRMVLYVHRRTCCE
uniref:lipopolysaccharide-induced tumor necrosis factor-alpha factor homolog isoform X2 n=1 Tax=Monopterus albus TaxID=43700 RepID=UPI0009B4CAFC|nr:lipopolysaccharide-induced tumor necrosis factor-alpha factor homolog isoform X2 [Monopterus albus]